MSSSAKIFEITIPQKKDLCCTICKIINTENDFLIYSNFCLNKLKCRQFLQETPQAMASPITNRKILAAGGSLYIIVTKEFFENCVFQDYCNALNIQMIDLVDPIPAYIYKACLLYTMECKLTPQWNKVGSYLVEGRDFLSSTGCVNAITLNIKEIHGNNARIQIEALNLKIPFIRLNERRPLQHDLQSPVRVLPSMKMANVLYVSKEIKEKYIFKNYDHLRAYWKDVYGYILPDYDEKLFYYEVEFCYFKSNVYIYPETCLTSGPLQILHPPADPVPIIYKFIGVLRNKVSKLCGQQLDICPEDTFTTIPDYTPILPNTSRFSAYDMGYGKQSKRVNTVPLSSRMSKICDIPTKRTRLSLSRSNDFLTCQIESDDFDLEISPTCSTSKLRSLKDARDMFAILNSTDNALIAKVDVKTDESKSHYFEQEDPRFHNKAFIEQEQEQKEEKYVKLNLKKKLLRYKDVIN